MASSLLEAPAGRAHLQPSPPRASPQAGTILFWALTALYLVPVWAFTYLPTQDGPAHLSSAVALKELAAPGTRYHEFFEVRPGPLPNWLAHLLLVGLMYVVPPLAAEKILVSCYVLSFAAATRYFLIGLRGAGRPLAGATLLFVYSRCFWLGFYNFCLSMVLFWLILGYVVRRRERLGGRQALVLAPLFLLAYFSHLFGFLLAAAGAGWLALLTRRPVRPVAWVSLAALPGAVLALCFLAGTGFFHSRAADRLEEAPREGLAGGPERVALELQSIPWQIFEPHWQGRPAPGLLLWLLLAGLAFACRRQTLARAMEQPRRAWPVAGLGLLLFLAYFLVPDHLGAQANSTEHGGFLKARLALVPTLLWLAAMPAPGRAAGRALTGAVVLLVAVNLAMVLSHCQGGNREIEEYVAGRACTGSGRTLFVLAPGDEARPTADPLLHAAGYYCLGAGNVCLENYQPFTNHFPLRARPGVARGFGDLAAYPRSEAVDVILDWSSPLAAGVPLAYREVFRQGRLRILAKQ